MKFAELIAAAAAGVAGGAAFKAISKDKKPETTAPTGTTASTTTAGETATVNTTVTPDEKSE